jgi:hypothetical protein
MKFVQGIIIHDSVHLRALLHMGLFGKSRNSFGRVIILEE